MENTPQVVIQDAGAPAELAAPKQPRPRGPSKAQQLNKLYSLPAPLRTFPLPTFLPQNPLSLLHIAYAWAKQIIAPESSHFPELYEAFFSRDNRCVFVLEERSVRGLWEQGFYGKGSLSRSEPSWLDREKKRRGAGKALTSEDITRKRREERQHTKWERARKEREAIDAKLKEEAIAAFSLQSPPSPTQPTPPLLDSPPTFSSWYEGLKYVYASVAAPVTPECLLKLPNSPRDVDSKLCVVGAEQRVEKTSLCTSELSPAPAPVTPERLLGLPNSLHDIGAKVITVEAALSNKEPLIYTLKLPATVTKDVSIDDLEPVIDIEPLPTPLSKSIEEANGAAEIVLNGTANGTHRRKSVRFSPTVEETTFIKSEPPSPERAAQREIPAEVELAIQNQEHYQLTLEEAFFLSYGLGALSIKSAATGLPIPASEMFTQFRTCSRFPPKQHPLTLEPDDPFVISYLVYHHFRSLGWVVRGGIKFSVDFLLYLRGPVFSHAEFAVIILPSYTDPYWSSTPELCAYVAGKERSWSWLHCVNRVITQVQKTLILVYVEIPKPQDDETNMAVDKILRRYKIREIVLKRWLSNRSRD
ncbi:hypothetical protein BP6252_02344 [Coleophoma cylindrospora]|uniref:tRNA-intron lyase n=1 Tax=Coleophoma cylindrospora TaxID=1849047 RepID=A0A3D8SF60_9HELO|nr:hypothetical protein BP6252_02344 [Coleophoma cylindrospora]